MKLKIARRIKIIKDKYPIPLSVFEFTPGIDINEKKYYYLSGAFYNKISYPIVALFSSDQDGNINSESPVIHEDGIANFDELFKLYGYTLTESIE